MFGLGQTSVDLSGNPCEPGWDANCIVQPILPTPGVVTLPADYGSTPAQILSTPAASTASTSSLTTWLSANSGTAMMIGLAVVAVFFAIEFTDPHRR